MAYFDNAATTYPKPDVVYSFMDSFYRNHGGSAGRGDYALANNAKSIIDESRLLLQELLHCPAKQVIFTPTATIALNIIIQGVIASGAKSIFISPFEHNAVTRVLHHFEQLGQITVSELAVSQSLEYDLTRMRYQFDANRPDFVIVSHASNVIGLVAPIENIFTLAKEYGAVTLVDMAQTAGLVDLNVGLETVDYAVFAGHKTLLGPTGISGFVMRPTAELPPILFGGTGYDSANQNMPDSLPEKYEMGTLNIAGVAGLNAALKWINRRTVERLYQEEIEQRQRLLNLLSDYRFLTVVGNVESRKYVGIVSCLINGISSDSAGSIFAERNISVRTGLQCAPKAHQFLGTYPTGTIRLSVNSMTSEIDFAELQNALDDIEAEL
jgi:cysteine desulfurase family protein